MKVVALSSEWVAGGQIEQTNIKRSALGPGYPVHESSEHLYIVRQESSRCPSLRSQRDLVTPYSHALVNYWAEFESFWFRNSKVWVGARLKGTLLLVSHTSLVHIFQCVSKAQEDMLKLPKQRILLKLLRVLQLTTKARIN